MGRYHEAYRAYGPIEEADSALSQRIDKARLYSVLESAEDAVHVNRIERALSLLDYADTLHSGHPMTTSLREHARRRRAVQLADTGEELLDNGTPRAAEAAFREAVAWDPTNAQAQRGQEESERRTRAMDAHGEELYFEGLDFVEQGDSLRAFTAFMHAAGLLGEGSGANQRFNLMSQELALDSLRQGQVQFKQGELGQAWLALTDAVHLDPANQEVRTLLQQVLDRIESERLLAEADLHVRGGRVNKADELFARILGLSGELHIGEVDDLKSRAIQERARREYALARACELDSQYVRAMGLYYQILEGTQGVGYEDLPVRVEGLERRLNSAAGFYRQALAAEAEGDAVGYLENLRQTVRLARDYEDASARLKKAEK